MLQQYQHNGVSLSQERKQRNQSEGEGNTSYIGKKGGNANETQVEKMEKESVITEAGNTGGHLQVTSGVWAQAAPAERPTASKGEVEIQEIQKKKKKNIVENALREGCDKQET